jgi:hypothetical protein
VIAGYANDLGDQREDAADSSRQRHRTPAMAGSGPAAGGPAVSFRHASAIVSITGKRKPHD